MSTVFTFGDNGEIVDRQYVKNLGWLLNNRIHVTRVDARKTGTAGLLIAQLTVRYDKQFVGDGQRLVYKRYETRFESWNVLLDFLKRHIDNAYWGIPVWYENWYGDDLTPAPDAE